MSLQLRNPHSVLAALTHRPDAVTEIRLGSQRPHGAWGDVVDAAKRCGVSVRAGGHQRESGRGRRSNSDRPGRSDRQHRASSAEATVREREAVKLDDLFGDIASDPGGPHPIWLALDCLQDPHNVGAIFRSAAFFGVRGLVTTKDKAAPLNGAVYDVASGGVETVPFSIVANLAQAFEQAKTAGLWILGTSEHAETEIADIPRDRPRMLVIGNEERGLRSLTLKRCDETAALMPRGEIASLNASVATAVLLSELTRH